MGKQKPRIHLPMTRPTRRQGRVIGIGKARCGLDEPKRWSFNPRRVTCGGCLHSLQAKQ